MQGSGDYRAPTKRALPGRMAQVRDTKQDTEPDKSFCIWCELEEVPEAGLTCSSDCFFLWWAHYNSMAIRGLIILPNDAPPPRLIHEQPWY